MLRYYVLTGRPKALDRAARAVKAAAVVGVVGQGPLDGEQLARIAMVQLAAADPDAFTRAVEDLARLVTGAPDE